ncbi:MAG: DUF4331 family protein [Ignavibacteria bacterium]
MRSLKNKMLGLLLLPLAALAISGCSEDTVTTTPGSTVTYSMREQMGRPAISTVFINSSMKDAFNSTPPNMMSAMFLDSMKAKLVALNGGTYTGNILVPSDPGGTNFMSLLATDELGVSKSGITSFYNGTQVLTGRALTDDVIDVELTLVFGGPTGASNPGLTSDHVNANDKPFLNTFPYLAEPW